MRGQVATFNLDTSACRGKRQDDLIELIENDSVEIICVQEASDVILENIIPQTHRTSQITRNAATRDTAVIWKRSAFEHGNTHLALARKAHAGGTKQETRYFCITTLRNKSDGRATRFISCNFPGAPARLKTLLQTPMARNLVSTVRDKRRNNMIIAGDFNFGIANDPYNLRNRLDMDSVSGPQGVGFYLTNNLNHSEASVIDRFNSDHPAIVVTVDL